MPVNTKEVKGRRDVKLSSIEDLKAEIDRLAGIEVEVCGNWSLAQIIAHLVVPMRMAVTEEIGWKPPLLIRLIAPILMKKKMLTKGFPPGFQIPEKAKHIFMPPDDITIEQAVESFHEAYDNYLNANSLAPNAFLGKLTREEWDQFQLRHAELHLSFVKDREAAPV